MKRFRRVKGDIFSVSLTEGRRYFQYLGSDQTQLGGDVIRVFRRNYAKDSNVDLKEIVSDKIDFFAHVFVHWGNRKNLWEKIGNVPYNDKVDVVFGTSNDSVEKWWVWKINEPQRLIGTPPKGLKMYLGGIFPPEWILMRLETGLCPGVWGERQLKYEN